MSKMAETLADLEAEYCPPLDPALLSAILSDYDLANQDDVRSARSTLDSLKEHAFLEEVAGFDASGTSGLDESLGGEERAESHAESSTPFSRATDATSVSNQLSSLDVEDPYIPLLGERGNFERLDEQTKTELLEEVFGKLVNRYTINDTLRKCNGNYQAAMEELLNHAYFAEVANTEDDVPFSAKGIEGFAEENIGTRGRKRKVKNKRFKDMEERRSSSQPESHDARPTNIWESPTKSAEPRDTRGGIQIVPLYARPDIDVESDQSTTSRKAKSAVSSRSPSHDAFSSAAARRDVFDLARAAALTQANAARRKAKSDHFMSGAAAYYSEVGREYAALSASASARAADQMVAAQSTATLVDLHGIDVQNAVRIAQEKVELWWDSLGESRVNGRIGAEERRSGLRIVVGLGRHSEGGHRKLAPAVMKMLKQEGWRFEPAGGEIIVKGPLKK